MRVRSHRFVCQLLRSRPLRSRRMARPRQSLSLPPMPRSPSSTRRRSWPRSSGRSRRDVRAGRAEEGGRILHLRRTGGSQTGRHAVLDGGARAEGIVIKTVGDDLILAGGRSARHAVRRLHLPRRPVGLPLVVLDREHDSQEADDQRGRDQHQVRAAAGVSVGVLVRRLRRRLGRAEQVQRPELTGSMTNAAASTSMRASCTRSTR